MRERIIAGNWKMYTDAASAEVLVRGIIDGLRGAPAACTVVICPPYIALPGAHALLGDSQVALGAQNVHYEEEGAFTGEIAATMLKSVGCSFVIIGHSERRQYFGETDATVNLRVAKALQHALRPIVCVGETLDEREAEKTFDVIGRQLAGAFAGIPESSMGSVVVAYEPVWAIGTGRTASPEQAEEVHAFIRATMRDLFSAGTAENLPILYGGSVKPDNAVAIFAQPDVDGGLIGGAALKAESFLAIVRARG